MSIGIVALGVGIVVLSFVTGVAWRVMSQELLDEKCRQTRGDHSLSGTFNGMMMRAQPRHPLHSYGDQPIPPRRWE